MEKILIRNGRKNQTFAFKMQCCGCGVCELICPKHAINMMSDEEVFLYPDVDMDKCVNCGLGEKKYAFKKNIQKF